MKKIFFFNSCFVIYKKDNYQSYHPPDVDSIECCIH